jgi:dinuclear metal center YbgI/SA1388 family protein
MRIADVCEYLKALAPERLAEDWDNVGLLVGDASRPVARVMTCLTITPDSAAEAIKRRADLIVAHHPLPFRPLKRLTTEHTAGKLLWQLIGSAVSIYSPHTAWDSASMGINQQLAEGLGLTQIQPLQPHLDDPDQLGSGRYGRAADGTTVHDVIEQTKAFLSLGVLQYVGRLDAPIQRVAVACGSAGSFLESAAEASCQLLVTGETSFHTCLEAESLGLSLILPGHFASERFAVITLAARLQSQFSQLEIWPSQTERDPLRWSGIT